MPILVLHLVSTAGAVCGLLYCCGCLWSAAAFHFRRRQARPGQFAPPVSILKPLCGIDPQGYESLRSHCLQDYPNFEIIFGVRDPDDPVVPAVERLIREFPSVSIKLLMCPRTSGMNLKVSNLLQMLPAARYEYLLINDSDIRVEQDYLRRAIAPLEDPHVGMVTCLFKGVAAGTLGSKLEAISIAADFIPGVLCATQLKGQLDFAMGSTLAFRRSTLDAIGGLEPLSDHLADDYEMGNRTFKAGLEVKLADCVTEHCLPNYSFAQFFNSPVTYRPGQNYEDALLAEWDEWKPQHFVYPRHARYYRYFLVRGGPENLAAAFGPYLAQTRVRKAGRWYLVERLR